MCALSMSSRLALRLLCGTLLVMALLDVPVTVGPEVGKSVGALLVIGVLWSAAVVLRRRKGPDGLPDSSTRRVRQESLVSTAIR
jgi:hypothetical protein